ncbi:MAG TPA: thiol:disulfide interchange protein DsbA/DsbL, partial [Steroidobacteraceae bacterium]
APSGASSSGAPATQAPVVAAGAADLTAAAVTQQESADRGAPADSGEAALERIAALPAEGELPAGKWIAGTNYKVISPAQPTNVAPGKVEVIEMFWYGCPHCYGLDPVLESWRKNKPDYIQFVRVPVMWDPVHRAHARLFYTLQVLGKLDALHSKVFETIHQDHNTLFVSGDPLATQRAQLKFATDNGISAADFLKAYNSINVQSKLQEADDLGRRYAIDAVPTFVIAGKYETDMGQAGGESNLLQLIDDLAASEKRH